VAGGSKLNKVRMLRHMLASRVIGVSTARRLEVPGYFYGARTALVE
jgi:hypothetical protein